MSVTSLFEVAVYAGLWVPYPLTDRDFLVAVRGLDLLDEHGCLLILFESADAAAEYMGYLNENRQTRSKVLLQRQLCPLVPGLRRKSHIYSRRAVREWRKMDI